MWYIYYVHYFKNAVSYRPEGDIFIKEEIFS